MYNSQKIGEYGSERLKSAVQEDTWLNYKALAVKIEKENCIRL